MAAPFSGSTEWHPLRHVGLVLVLVAALTTFGCSSDVLAAPLIPARNLYGEPRSHKSLPRCSSEDDGDLLRQQGNDRLGRAFGAQVVAQRETRNHSGSLSGNRGRVATAGRPRELLPDAQRGARRARAGRGMLSRSANPSRSPRHDWLREGRIVRLPGGVPRHSSQNPSTGPSERPTVSDLRDGSSTSGGTSAAICGR